MHIFVPRECKTGENSFEFKNNVTILTTISVSLFANTGVYELYCAKIHMKVIEQNQMSFVKLKLSVFLDRRQLEIL